MGGTSTETMLADIAVDQLSRSTLLGSSIGSLSSPRRGNTQISKTYKQASNLFLTRRLSEALFTIEPLVSVPTPDENSPNNEHAVAPIANASRSSRIKVWNLYLTLLNSIIELGPEKGKSVFGYKPWRAIRDKARDGSIWDEVVDRGYGGIEEKVDADVVINLYVFALSPTLPICDLPWHVLRATLLLSQSPTQTKNQQRLESYLAAPSESVLDLAVPLELSGSSTNANHHRNYWGDHDEGTNTPRELASRIQILELYTLHILPRNDEWAYAREFISMSHILDEENREAFLQTLQNLQDETAKDPVVLEEGISQDLDQEAVPKPKRQDTNDTQTTKTLHHRPTNPSQNSDQDYGISPSPPPLPNPPALPTLRPSKPLLPPTLHKPFQTLFIKLHTLLSQTTSSITRNPFSAVRLALFVAALIAALRQRRVTDRIGRMTGQGWDKVKRTVGMGVKVSYI